MKEYFEIEASKSAPQYVVKMGLKIFGGDGGIELPRMNLRSTYLEEDVLTCYPGRTLRETSEKKHYSISCFS